MALQLVAEAALSSCFQTLFQQLGPILHSRHLWNWGVGEELKRLERKLSRIQVVLNDAEARILDEKVNFWVEDLRELVYDMEDIIDDMNTKRLQLDQAASSQAGDYQVGNFSFPFKMVESVTKVPVNIMMKGKIVEVLGRLDEISLEADALGFKNETTGTSSMTYQARLNPETGPFVDESEVYGREKDKENIIDLLTTSTCSSKKRYTVIPIVGMGGIGKTTLAQLVFNDQRLENYFDLKSWACVSDVVDIKKVTKELVEFATKENCSDMAFVALQGRLREMVMNKRCLLVLDDVWMAKQWEKLVAPLNCCANGSKILITTRIEKVAKEICNSGGYELKNLEEETCWDLFKEKAFQEVDAYTNGNLENIGRGIVKKCRGVPLAVKVVGAILRDAAEEKWESVLRNDLWQIVDGDDDENFPALRMSYHYLPSHLKRCFEYLSLFPTDYSLDEGELARMWIAEGLIAAQKDRLLEDIASEYYEEMKRRSLIQNDNRMHDLVHSLSCLVSKKFYCRVPNDSLSCKMERIRHASLFDKRVKVTDLDLLLQAKSLRTLLHIDGKYSIFDESSSYALWERISKWNLLRVLDIGKADTVELLSCIGNLKPLRYLHLSLNSEIRNLPDSVCELYNLQTLDVSQCQLNSLPKDIGNLQNLRYLNLSYASIVTLPSSISKLMNLVTLKLSGCKSLVEVAENIGNLLSLREFDLGHCYKLQHRPNSICKLHNLKVLNLSSCMQLSHLPEGIRDLQNLRKLLLSKIPILSLPESICKLSRLEVLDLSSCSRLTHLPKDVGDLERLKRLDLGHTYLSLPDSIVKITCLQALGNMRNCPPHVGKLANLKCLEQYIVGKETGRRIGELKNLNNLEGSLVISHLENVDSGKEASMADLKRKKHISGLTFEWSPLLPANDDGGGSSSVVRDEEVELKVLEALEPDSTAVTSLSFVCYNGNKFPEWMFEARFSSLERLEMKGLNKIRSVVDLELPLLMKLEIVNCPSLKDVLMVPPKLNELRVENCQELSGLFLLPSVQDNDSNSNMISWRIDLPQLMNLNIRKCPNLRQLFMAVPLLRYLDVRDLSLAVNGLLPPILECLYIYNCENLVLLLKDEQLPKLWKLWISNCENLKSLFKDGQQWPKLQVLWISNCENLKSLFKDGQQLPKLQVLSISNCENLKSLFKDGQKLPYLRVLSISNCENLELLAMDWTSAPKLESLTLEACPQLVSFPDGNEKLPPTLTSLTLEYCTQLVLLPEEGLPPALDSLNILGCPQLESFPACHNLTSLKYIKVYGCPQLESFPEVCLPPMLGGLRIKSCKNLRYLPKDLCNLTSLFHLEIEDCPEVEARPDDRLPSNFLLLFIKRCPKLEQQLKEENRSDWLRLMR